MIGVGHYVDASGEASPDSKKRPVWKEAKVVTEEFVKAICNLRIPLTLRFCADQVCDPA